MTGSCQYASRTGRQRKYMPRLAEILKSGHGICAFPAGQAPLFCGNACGGVNMVHGNGECRSVIVGVLLHHLFQPQAFRNLCGHGGADQSSGMCCHKVYIFRRGELGGADHIALIFTVRIIHTQDDAAGS